MNNLIGTNKTPNSTGQKSLSFGAKQLKTLEQFKTPNELLKYARKLAVNSEKPNKGERLLSDAFERAINVKKNKEHIFDTAKNLLAYYMVETPSKFLTKAEEIGIKLNNSIGEVGLKLKNELVGCFPSIKIISSVSAKKPARECVDHIINNTTYKRLRGHIELVKGARAADNLEFLD